MSPITGILVLEHPVSAKSRVGKGDAKEGRVVESCYLWRRGQKLRRISSQMEKCGQWEDCGFRLCYGEGNGGGDGVSLANKPLRLFCKAAFPGIKLHSLARTPSYLRTVS